jgi:flagellar protein FlgJ
VFSKISETSQNARRSLTEIDRLGNLLNQFQSGGAAAFKQFAGNFGIDTKNLSEIQAAEAIISRLVPQQRPPNSGTMSDADLAEFKKSLPRIINRPGANQIIIKTLRDIANYQIREGEIADMVMDQEITPAEGRKRLRELVNPIDTFFAGGVYQQYGLEPRR